MYYNKKKCRAANLLIVLSVVTAPVWSQSNKPTAQTQASTPIITVPTAPSGYATGTLINYIRIWDAAGPWTDAATFPTQDNNETKQTTAYVDGLGRSLQTVIRQASPNGKDIVAPVVYDAFGREAYQYMDYTSTDATGNFKQDPFNSQQTVLQAQYPGEQVFFSKTEFEPSPLNRITKKMAPGNSWAGSEKGTQMKYLVNTTADAVRIWRVNNNVAPESGPLDLYDAGRLFKTVSIDEAGHAVVEYKDKEGLIVLKKVQVKDGVASDFSGTDEKWLMTYFIYDAFNRLRFVLSPKAVSQLRDVYNWQLASGGVANIILEELCFQYTYDYRNRIVAKKIPGSGWIYMIYDQRDRIVFTQDANLRTRNQWVATLYDDLNRNVTTGIMIYASTPDALQALVNVSSSANGNISVTGNTPFSGSANITLNTLQTGVHHYQATSSIDFENGFETDGTTDLTAEITSIGSGNSFTDNIAVNANPIPEGASFIPLRLTYYDNYAATNRSYTTSYNSALTAGINLHAVSNPSISEQADVDTKGAVTVTKVRTLPDINDLTAGVWLTSTQFYDKKGRMIQSHYDNYKGGTDINTNLYNFQGQMLCSVLKHNNPQSAEAALQTITVRSRIEYDIMNRIIKLYKAVNEDYTHEKLIVDNSYNESGQLFTKQLGINVGDLGKLEFNYNVRGWLQGINKNYANTGSGSRAFGMELNYDWGFESNQYNGNIAGVKWKSMGDNKERSYGFGYDMANRILSADFKQQNGAAWDNSAGINFTTYMGNGTAASAPYDENGNILKMQQWGLKVNVSSLIDDLSYTYTSGGVSNKLQNVTDEVNSTDTKLGDFRTSATSSNLVPKTNHADPNSIVDYTYDDNGNLVTDLNKDIRSVTGAAGIQYNFLNLPVLISVNPGTAQKGNITYIYDAAGNKLEKITDEPVSATNSLAKHTSTVYLDGFVYENNHLQSFDQEEGRVRWKLGPDGNNPVFVYDFFIKDHLGNIRSVLTDETQVDKYPVASLEPSKVAKEKDYYDVQNGNIVDKTGATGITDYSNDNGIGNNPSDPSFEADNSTKLYQLNSTSAKTGLGITLKVMAGDKVDVFGKSYYFQNNPGAGPSDNLPLADLLAGFLNSPTGAAVTSTHGVVTLSTINTPIGVAGINDMINEQTTQNSGAPSKPRAFINIVFFNEQFQAVDYKISMVGSQNSVYDHTDLHNLSVAQNGYVYIYCSNETPVNVFFDNFQVVHTRGPLLEETHYYPFGLTMAGISSKAAGSLENKRKWNKASELENKEFSDCSGLELYSTQFRSLDPQLGKFWQIDPKPDYSQSLYSSMNNNPISFNDPLGDTIRTSFRTGFLGIFGKKATLTYDEKKQRWNNKDGSAYAGKTTKFSNMVLNDLKMNQKNELGNTIVTNLATDNLEHNIIKGDPNGNRTDNPNIYYNGSGSSSDKVLQGGQSLSSPSYVTLGHEMSHKFDQNLGIKNIFWFGTGDDKRGVDEYNAMYYENILRQANGLLLRTAYQETNGVPQGVILNAAGALEPMPVGLSAQGISLPAYHTLQLFLRLF